MLEFTLSMDCECYSAASISTSDREHFIHMAEASRQLRTTLGQPTGPRTAEVRPTPEERRVLAAYFWKYLHEPCKALSLPLDCVYNNIVHLSRYTHEHGGYKGSVFGILQQYGVKRLASKLYMDREFLMPRVFSDYNTQIKMIQAVKKVEQLYFVRISGFEGSTQPDSGPSGWSRVQNVEYEANERGIAYVFSRRAAIARACKNLSVGFWATAVGECVEAIVARFKLVKAGERTADYTWASWRGERDKFPDRISPRSEVRNPPGGWRRVMLYHIPDYFEFRDQIEMHDC